MFTIARNAIHAVRFLHSQGYGWASYDIYEILEQAAYDIAPDCDPIDQHDIACRWFGIATRTPC